MSNKPNFAVVVGYYVPADSQWDPARHTRTVTAYTQTAAWAQVLARRAYEAHFVYTGTDGVPSYDDQGYTEVYDMATGRNYCPPRAIVESAPDLDIPF